MNCIHDCVLIRQSEYHSIISTFKTREEMGIAALLLIEQGLSGERQTNDDPATNMLLSMSYPLQVSARQRYAHSKENGKLGGRPQTVNRQQVIDLRSNGYTQKQIADEIGCSVSAVQNALSKYNVSDTVDRLESTPTSQYTQNPGNHPYIAKEQENNPFDDDDDGVPF